MTPSRIQIIPLIFIAAFIGCGKRSADLPLIQNWVTYNCPDEESGMPVATLKMPGNPVRQTTIQHVAGITLFPMHTYTHDADGIYGVLAVTIPKEQINDPPQDLLQTEAKSMATVDSLNVHHFRPFQYQGIYPALDFAGTHSRLNELNFRGRMILHKEQLLFLLAIGKQNVVMEPEVSYFVDSVGFPK